MMFEAQILAIAPPSLSIRKDGENDAGWTSLIRVSSPNDTSNTRQKPNLPSALPEVGEGRHLLETRVGDRAHQASENLTQHS